MMIKNDQGKRFLESGYPIFCEIMKITGVYEMNCLGRKRSKPTMQFFPAFFITIAIHSLHVLAIYVNDILV